MKARPEVDMAKIEVTGFTNASVVGLFSLPSTAVRQPAFEMGQKATELLIQQIESKYPIEDFETIVFPTALIEHGLCSRGRSRESFF